MTTPEILQLLQLDFNPFEPAATGAPLRAELSPPDVQKNNMEQLLDSHNTGQGVKAIVMVGEYGAGKTCLLQWLHQFVFPKRQIKSFYFDNPGVQFYDLANMLLRTIGRKDFAKFIWELAGPYVETQYQTSLFQDGFEEYLSREFSQRQQRNKPDMTSPLQDAIMKSGITSDEEIAQCLARIVTEVIKKPYFEYRDFIPRQKGSVVPENEEAPYFRSILKTISQGTGANAIAFLIDEFEEISLQKRLTKRDAYDYLATLKRLINLAESQEVDFWIVMSMTPDAYERTKELDPALEARFTSQVFGINPITVSEALDLMKSRIAAARSNEQYDSIDGFFPFPDRNFFRRTTYSNPRRLIKTCFRAIAQANTDVQLPFSERYLCRIEEELYPSSKLTGNADP